MPHNGTENEREPSADDFSAAEEVLARFMPSLERGTPEYRDKREALARFRARMDKDRFDLGYGLRLPRNSVEQAQAEFMQGRITQEQLAMAFKADAERPIDVAMLDVFCDAYEERLMAYSEMLQAVIAIATDQREPDTCRRREAEVDRKIEAMEAKLPLLKEQVATVSEFLTELQAERKGDPVRCGDCMAASAHMLASRAMDRAVAGWRSSKEIAHRSRTDPSYLYATSASKLFYKSHLPSLPKPQELQALMILERTRARKALQEQARATKSDPPAPEALAILQERRIRLEHDAKQAEADSSKKTVLRASPPTAAASDDSTDARSQKRKEGKADDEHKADKAIGGQDVVRPVPPCDEHEAWLHHGDLTPDAIHDYCDQWLSMVTQVGGGFDPLNPPQELSRLGDVSEVLSVAAMGRNLASQAEAIRQLELTGKRVRKAIVAVETLQDKLKHEIACRLAESKIEPKDSHADRLKRVDRLEVETDLAKIGAKKRTAPTMTGRPPNAFCKEGDTWRVTFGGISKPGLANIDGMLYIARLLQTPNVPVDVLDLWVLAHPANADEMERLKCARALDRPILKGDDEYLTDLRTALQEGNDHPDDPAAQAAAAEARDMVAAMAPQLQGHRNEQETKMKRRADLVKKAIDRVRDGMKAHNKELAQHLIKAIETGYSCVYHSDPAAPSWVVDMP